MKGCTHKTMLLLILICSYMYAKMKGWLWNRELKSDLISEEKITRAGPTRGKKYVFILACMIMIMFTKSYSVYLEHLQEQRSFTYSLFGHTNFWLKKASENNSLGFSFSWLFVTICGLKDWFSLSYCIDETPPGASSGNSSCADNFELSYLVTVQTRVNAQICFRCLSPYGFHFFLFLFSRLKPDWCGWFCAMLLLSSL